MRIEEGLFGFDAGQYIQKIGSSDYSYKTLATNIYKKRRAIVCSVTSAIAGVAAVHVSGGTSLLGSAWAGRNISVEKQKLRLLEAEWARRGQPPLQKCNLTDTIIPIVLTGALGLFTFTIDLAILDLAETAATVTANAAAMGLPGYEFHGHAVGAYYTVVEKAWDHARGSYINSLPNASNGPIDDSPPRGK